MSKHTPGPWVAKEDGKYRDSPWSIDHEDGHDASWAPISTAKGRTLAIVVNDDSKRPMDFQEEEMHANATLIAAAPDLLEALQRLQTAAYNVGGEHVTEHQQLIDAADSAQSAIAKALTGESK